VFERERELEKDDINKTGAKVGEEGEMIKMISADFDLNLGEKLLQDLS